MHRLLCGRAEQYEGQAPEIQVPYYSLHNHPSNGILSPEDIQQLIKRPQMQGIGAVGNAGALFTCEKVFGYSQKNAEGWFKALKEISSL